MEASKKITDIFKPGYEKPKPCPKLVSVGTRKQPVHYPRKRTRLEQNENGQKSAESGQVFNDVLQLNNCQESHSRSSCFILVLCGGFIPLG